MQDLRPNSNYLLKMDKAFAGTSFLSQVMIFWAYETRLSPTVVVRIFLSLQFGVSGLVIALAVINMSHGIAKA